MSPYDESPWRGSAGARATRPGSLPGFARDARPADPGGHALRVCLAGSHASAFAEDIGVFIVQKVLLLVCVRVAVAAPRSVACQSRRHLLVGGHRARAGQATRPPPSSGRPVSRPGWLVRRVSSEGPSSAGVPFLYFLRYLRWPRGAPCHATWQGEDRAVVAPRSSATAVVESWRRSFSAFRRALASRSRTRCRTTL